MKTLKVFPYVKTRDKMISEIVTLTGKIYGNDKSMVMGISELLTNLKMAEPNDISHEFIQNLYGFIQWANSKNEPIDSMVVTIIHDLGEFSRNRNEAWFCPRSSRFGEFFKS